MKNSFIAISIVLISLLSFSVFSQSKTDPVSLGLPGDNLDLYAVMEMFQKSKTIEDFEKKLNSEESKLNNLDLDNDKKVDFIKVITNKDGDSFSFVLQVAVSKTENQDVAVIFVSKDKKGNVNMQIVGDEVLYGKDYVVEPKSGSKSDDTVNPAYTGGGTDVIVLDAPKTTVVVQSAPIVQYVYSPAYVPYYPPYYYGYYPPYYHPFAPIAFGIFWANNYHCHGGYYGGYHGSVNINVNHVNHYNNYNNNSRRTSNTVNHNKANGSYGNRVATNNNRNSASTRPTSSTRPANKPAASTRPSATTRPSNSASSRPTTRPTTPTTRPSTRPSNGVSTRPASNYSRPSSSSNSYNRSSSYGGGRISGAGGGRFGGGGAMRGGGVGRR